METLKSGDVPALVTNMEVMQILTARADARRKGAEAEGEDVATGRKRRKRPDDRRHRHRDWIEGKLLDYLKSSPCGADGVDRSKMGELVGKLRGVGSAADDTTATDAEMSDAVKSSPDDNSGQELEQSGGGGANYGLTDGETLQILNHMPSELVELHLMIEDLPDRMADERQEELLALVGEYAGQNNEGQQQQEEQGMEQDVEEHYEEEVVESDYSREHGSKTTNKNTSRERGAKNDNGDKGCGEGSENEEILGTISDEE
mmetsp:Transcript_3888/g.8376  ORF Transcript_3888/g.8376 Transcript_3888/m.8376 type:complete len:260 (+) Transcript_3888:193-972(+)